MKAQLLILGICFFYINVSGQNITTKSIPEYNISQLSFIGWDPQIGLPYKQVPGANLGAISFVLLNSNRIAFLSSSTSEIIITKKYDGKIIKRFQVAFAPRDFVYDEGFFYVLSEYQINKYDENGKQISKTSFSDLYKGVERIARYNKSNFLLLPTGNSLMIDSCGISITPKICEGVITNTGVFVSTQIKDNTYTIKLVTKDGKKYNNTIVTDKKVAGVYVVGITKNQVVLDVQTFVSENPINVERYILSINLDSKSDTIASRTKVPDCYYVLSNKDFDIDSSGHIINMVSSPFGVFIFLLSERRSNTSQKSYPATLRNIKYHFNNHLLNLEK